MINMTNRLVSDYALDIEVELKRENSTDDLDSINTKDILIVCAAMLMKQQNDLAALRHKLDPSSTPSGPGLVKPKSRSNRKTKIFDKAIRILNTYMESGDFLRFALALDEDSSGAFWEKVLAEAKRLHPESFY